MWRGFDPGWASVGPVFPRSVGGWFGLLVGLMLCAPSGAIAADRIVLRNLKIISGKEVLSFDPDGVKLQGEQVVPWDEIEKGTVSASQQAEFDRMLKQLGEPLYRIRKRLDAGDYEGLLEHAEPVSAHFVGRRSKTAYMVFQALMWGRLAAGQREKALAPYLYCFEYARAIGVKKATLPGNRRLQCDVATGMTTELAPVWFDPRAAKEALPEVKAAGGSMSRPIPEGVLIYYATLALTAGEQATASKVFGGVKGSRPVLAQLRDIAMAQQEVVAGRPGQAVGRLEAAVDRLEPENKPLAVYWLGMAKLGADHQRTRYKGVLQLLRLPALYGKSHPDLAGAGLAQTMQTLEQLGDRAGTRAVRKELMIRYGQTWHAARIRAKINSREDQ